MQIQNLRCLDTEAALIALELRRLENEVKSLETVAAPSDPILANMLAATRACRDQLIRRRNAS